MATTAPETAQRLREQLRRTQKNLTEALAAWQALTDAPEHFQRREALASVIADLRQQVATLPTLIDAADLRERQLAVRTAEAVALHAAASQRLDALLARLAVGAEVRALVSACQEINGLLSKLRVDAPEAALPQPLYPRQAVQQRLALVAAVVGQTTPLVARARLASRGGEDGAAVDG